MDVYEAIEGEDSFIHSTQLADRVFPAKTAVAEGTKEVLSIVYEAEKDFKKRLKRTSIADLLLFAKEGEEIVDWR